MRKYVNRDGYGGSAGETTKINANAESLVCDVEDLTNITIGVIQLVDSGTVALQVYYSLDGTYFIPNGAAIAHTDFAAGAGTALGRALSDGNGMPLAAKKVKLLCSAYGASGSYALVVGGHQKDGYG